MATSRRMPRHRARTALVLAALLAAGLVGTGYTNIALSLLLGLLWLFLAFRRRPRKPLPRPAQRPHQEDERGESP
ncbi:hypothetical protein NI17_018590 [Thermobifida halotolerans]|uniref:Uncharacterized protein n=1 Tax=Thermobifida halotolerans TaxID=483545 RepID=A0A399FYT5_9ACTN|nr:hypothetical protein [Thermobifida halotolerans]UOE18769.1 hypothetical protein NI17_018590 [Thermobifida halotolerans]